MTSKLEPAPMPKPTREEVVAIPEANTGQPTASAEEIRLVTRDGCKVLAGGPRFTGAQIAESIGEERALASAPALWDRSDHVGDNASHAFRTP